MKIYLAGGMRPRVRTNAEGLEETFIWQKVVAGTLKPQHEVLDPRSNETKVFKEYSFLDLAMIRQCDVVITYIELENPSCMGLAGEIGYAKGLGKTTLLINEKHEDRYTKFTENFADVVFNTFEEALHTISKL